MDKKEIAVVSENMEFTEEDADYKSFFDLMDYVRVHNMCTRPGCTTCGCMPFRNLCKKEIGYRKMCELINAVSQEQILNEDPENWYEPLRIVYDAVFPHLPVDTPLMKEYFRIRSILFAQFQSRREETEKRVQAEREQAAQRKAERERKAEEHRERSRIKNEEYRRRHHSTKTSG